MNPIRRTFPLLTALLFTGCAWLSKNDKQLIEIAKQECIVMRQDFPNQVIADVCGVPLDVVQAVVGPARSESNRHAILAQMHADTVQCYAITPATKDGGK